MSDDQYEEALKVVRAKIDAVDEGLLRLLAERWQLVKEVHDVKKAKGLPIRQNGRYQEMVSHLRIKADELGVDPRLVHAIWEVIHEQSIRSQEELDDLDG